MAELTLKGNKINSIGTLPKKGTKAPEFTLVSNDLEEKKLANYKGSRIILNIFPSVDTGVCADSVRKFNKKATEYENTKVLCISRDLPFALDRFCGAEGLENVITLSDFRDGQFGKDYQLQITDGPLKGLNSRVVIVLDEKGEIIYTQQVKEITDEPDYESALSVL